MEVDCENWKTLFEETERTRSRDPLQLVQLATISNSILLGKKHRQTELARKKQQLVLLQKSLGERCVQSRSNNCQQPPLNVLQQVQNEEVEQNTLNEKLRNIEYALNLQRMKNGQLEQTLTLYMNQQGELETLTTRLHRERQLLIGERMELLRRMESTKIKQEHAVERLRTARDQTEEQCKLQISTARSPNIINLQKNCSEVVLNPMLCDMVTTAVEQSEELAASRPCSKMEVKEMLRCFYVLSRLSSRSSNDIQNVDIIEKSQARMLSKSELISYFERKHFPVDQRFEELICKRYHLLKEELKGLEVQYHLQQEQIKEKEERLRELEAEYRQYRSDREVLEGLKLNEELLRNFEAAANLNDGLTIRYVQFYYSFLSRMFRIAGCIRLVVEGLLVESVTLRKLNDYTDEFQSNPSIVKYGELASLKEIAKINFYEGSLVNEPEMVVIKNSRLIRMFSFAEQLQQTSTSTPAATVEDLILKSHRQAACLLDYLTSVFQKLFRNLQRAVQPKKLLLTSRTERFRDAYCIESPDFYCRDNMKLIEKIENMKMKNMGSRKQLPAENELFMEKQPQKVGRDRSPQELSFLRRRNPLGPVKARLSTPKMQQASNHNLSKTSANEFGKSAHQQTEDTQQIPPPLFSPHSNLLSQRKRLEQSQNMSVRNMLGIVKKIGILDSSRARTSRRQQRQL